MITEQNIKNIKTKLVVRKFHFEIVISDENVNTIYKIKPNGKK